VQSTSHTQSGVGFRKRVCLCRGQGVSGLALTETDTLAHEFQNVTVMGEAVEQGTEQPLIGEELCPFTEGQVGGNQLVVISWW